MKYDFRQDNHLGTMRFDFADGETNIANKWFPYGPYEKEEIKEFQDHCNDIMFNRFNAYSKIISYCGGVGHNHEARFEEETEHFFYGVKLIPELGEYNGYIFVHRKDAA